jgi:2-haloacid dehalogenase/putative hydrolase of the HAD superfamily
VSARPYDIITFDCYGTLIDWEAGIAGAFARAVVGTGGRVDPRSALAAYEKIEPVVQAERYRTYREVLTESARRVARELGWALPEARADFLAESLPFWIPFPDTNAALERLFKAGYQLGILSNVDDDLLTGTRKHFTVPFDLIVTAQQVGSYKPADAHFTTARARIGGRRWLHAARSHFHDVTPCRRLGVPVAWINRARETRGEPRPDRELSTLTALADWLA